MQAQPSSRGDLKAGQALGLVLLHLQQLIESDEFPLNRVDLIRSRNSIRALQTIRNRDRRQGYHNTARPRIFEVPPEMEDDFLPPMPPKTGWQPQSSLRLADTSNSDPIETF